MPTVGMKSEKRGRKSAASIETVLPASSRTLDELALPPAPGHLTPSTAAWWRELVEIYELGAHQLTLLRLCCEAVDRCEEARAAIEAEGAYYTDRFGAPKPHPAIAVERDAKIGIARLLRELQLDDASPPLAPRPPGLGR